MEELIDRGCSVVYYCDRQDEEISELYNEEQPPQDTLDVAPKDNWREAVYSNVRMLLDEDQGGFYEGETRVRLQPGNCLANHEQYLSARMRRHALTDSILLQTACRLWSL